MHIQVRGGGIRAGEAVASGRLGIFGGAFNPPHVGHLILAQEAHSQLGLDSVALIPFGAPAHRRLEDEPGAEVRVELCERAVAGDERFTVSRVEVERPGPSYTVDTLRELRASAEPDDELFLLLGGDQAAALTSWRDPEEVLSLAVAAVGERDEWRREEIVERLGGLCSPERVVFFDMPRIEVSSTLVRRRVREGRPIRYLVPREVEGLVLERGLYGAGVGVGS